MYIQNQSETSLFKEKLSLERIYSNISERINDPGIKSSVQSDFVKNLKSLDKIEKKLIRLRNRMMKIYKSDSKNKEQIVS